MLPVVPKAVQGAGPPRGAGHPHGPSALSCTTPLLCVTGGGGCRWGSGKGAQSPWGGEAGGIGAELPGLLCLSPVPELSAPLLWSLFAGSWALGAGLWLPLVLGQGFGMMTEERASLSPYCVTLSPPPVGTRDLSTTCVGTSWCPQPGSAGCSGSALRVPSVPSAQVQPGLHREEGGEDSSSQLGLGSGGAAGVPSPWPSPTQPVNMDLCLRTNGAGWP